MSDVLNPQRSQATQRRIQTISNHLVSFEPTYTTPNFVNGDSQGLKAFFNQYLRGRALDKIKNVVNKRNPKNVGTLETVFIWLAIVLVSMPWLSYILFLSFIKTTRKRKVSMINAWATFVLTKLLGVRLFIDDREANAFGEPPYVFVLLNQSSLLETILILPAALPSTTEVFAFANIEFLMIPILGWVFWKTLGSEMVIRQNSRQAKKALDRAMTRMTHDKASMIISIEGKRSSDGGLSEYKRGPAVLAIKTGATIIPLVTHGCRDIWGYGDWRLKIGGDVTVKFLPAIPTKGMTLDDRFSLTDKLRKLAEEELKLGSN